MSWLRRERVGDLAGSERALLVRMLAGEEAAFEVFSSAYVPIVYRFAQRALGDRETTREVVQTTVCKAIAQLRAFRGEAGLATWLCAICRNEIAAHFRRRQRRVEEVELTEETMPAEPVFAAPPGPEQSLLHKERARLVHQALDALPPHYGQALEWKYLDQLSVEEIAQRQGVRTKAAESTLTRARRAFQEAYGNLLGGAARPKEASPRKTAGAWTRPEHEEMANDR